VGWHRLLRCNGAMGKMFPTLIVNKSVINEGRIMQRLPYMTSSSAIKC